MLEDHPKRKVRTWAKRMLREIDSSVKSARDHDDEWNARPNYSPTSYSKAKRYVYFPEADNLAGMVVGLPRQFRPQKKGGRALAMMRSEQFGRHAPGVCVPAADLAFSFPHPKTFRRELGITMPFPPPPHKAQLSVIPPVAGKGAFPARWRQAPT